MHSQPNARRTQRGGHRLVTQQLEHVCSLPVLAAENRISLRCAYSCLARYRSGVPTNLAKRWRVRRSSDGRSIRSK
jgi:hypothetical protein